MTRSATVVETTLEHLTRTIVEYAQPRRVILFGSRARREDHEDSDYDIYIEIDAESLDRNQDSAIALALRENDLDADIIVASKKKFDERRDDPGTVEWDVAREGLVLYSRPGVTAARVYERPPGTPSLRWWIEKAETDYQAVDQLLAATPQLWGPICFHAHEAVEKLLKAMIVSLGRRPLRSHNLKKLLHQCPRELRDNQALRNAVACVYGQPKRYVRERSRYPDGPELDRVEAESIVAAARVIRDILRPQVRQT